MNLAAILAYLQATSEIVGQVGSGDVATGARFAEILLQIAQAAVKAHEAVSGQPIDLDLLKDIEKVS